MSENAHTQRKKANGEATNERHSVFACVYFLNSRVVCAQAQKSHAQQFSLA